MATAQHTSDRYYLPHGSYWPIVGSTALFGLTMGAASLVNGYSGLGYTLLAIGAALMLWMLFGWFGTVIGESEGGLFNKQVDLSFRWGMSWFIFSEVMFFAAFFGALYYARQFSVPWLSDLHNSQLWPNFKAVWPTQGPYLSSEFAPMGWWWIPAFNTTLLLSSGVTITIAHWALKQNKRAACVFWMWCTIALGVTFLSFQAYEYGHAYADLNLKLSTGVYGATFFMLTGFHGMHVTLGAIMLTVITLRLMKGHFTPSHHFGFEAVAWYWHFVDVVWLMLFIFVYVL